VSDAWAAHAMWRLSSTYGSLQAPATLARGMTVRSTGEAQRLVPQARPGTYGTPRCGSMQRQNTVGAMLTDSEDTRRYCQGRARVGPLDPPTLLVGRLLRDIWGKAGVVCYPSPVRPLSVHGAVGAVVDVAPPPGRRLGSGRR
jgi:hypothetical protein